MPSVNEGELLKGFNFTTWTGYFVKRDTPADVVARLHAALNAAMQDTEVKRGLETQNIEVSAPMTRPRPTPCTGPRPCASAKFPAM